MSTMRAAIYKGVKKIELIEKKIPIAKNKDVIVKIKKAGICGTDLTAFNYGGDSVAIFPENEFGHEMVGEIVEIGNEVSGLELGERVFINPLTFRPVTAVDRGGAFSEFVLVENATIDDNIFLIPDNVSYDEAILIEPYSVGIHGKNIPEVSVDSKVVIFGAGTIGMCALAGVLATGARDVVVVDMDERRLEMVKEMGGHTYNLNDSLDLNTYLISLFGESLTMFNGVVSDADIYIDCAGANSILETFMKSAKMNAALSVVAVHKHENEINLANMMWSQLKIMGSFMYTTEDIKEAIENLSQKNTKIPMIVTQKFSQNDIMEAFEVASDVSKSIKVVIDYDLD